MFLINHLRKWQEWTCEVNAVIEDGDGIEEYRWSNGYQPQFGQRLSCDQKEEVRQLLPRFHQVTKDNPGRTDKATHRYEPRVVHL